MWIKKVLHWLISGTTVYKEVRASITLRERETEVREELRKELIPEITKELEVQLRKNLLPQVESSLQEELKPRVKRQVLSELKQSLTKSIRSKLKLDAVFLEEVKQGFEDIYVIPFGVLEILDSTGQKIDEVDIIQEISSEAKRSMVYGSLIKRHPDVSRKHIAIAIEIIMNGRK